MLAFALCAMFTIGLLTGIIATVSLAVHLDVRADAKRVAAKKTEPNQRCGPNPFTPNILKD